MRLVRLNKVIEETDPGRIRDYKLLGFVEEGEAQKTSGAGREPAPEKPTELTELPEETKSRRGRPAQDKRDSKNDISL